LKIGVFDSGVGGITVLLELRKQLPGADFVYLGDTANVPYGPKSPKVVERLCLDAVSELSERGIDALVVACNTASAVALPAIRGAMKGTPVLGVVEPGARAAIEAVRAFQKPEGVAPVILVLATRATVNSGAYKRALASAACPKPTLVSADPSHMPKVIEQACPLLVPMIEEGWLDHPLLHGAVQEYVSDHFRSHPPGVALLGCTHYPWIQPAIELSLPGWKVVNSAEAVARSFKPELAALPPDRLGGGSGKMEWIFTDPHAVPAFARRWVYIDK
jgi:glutamate racemase